MSAIEQEINSLSAFIREAPQHLMMLLQEPTFGKPSMPNRTINPFHRAARYQQLEAQQPDFEGLRHLCAKAEKYPMSYDPRMDAQTKQLNFDKFCLLVQIIQYKSDLLKEWERERAHEEETLLQYETLNDWDFAKWVRNHDQNEFEYKLSRNKTVYNNLDKEKAKMVQVTMYNQYQQRLEKIAKEETRKTFMEDVKARAKSAGAEKEAAKEATRKAILRAVRARAKSAGCRKNSEERQELPKSSASASPSSWPPQQTSSIRSASASSTPGSSLPASTSPKPVLSATAVSFYPKRLSIALSSSSVSSSSTPSLAATPFNPSGSPIAMTRSIPPQRSLSKPAISAVPAVPLSIPPPTSLSKPAISAVPAMPISIPPSTSLSKPAISAAPAPSIYLQTVMRWTPLYSYRGTLLPRREHPLLPENLDLSKAVSEFMRWTPTLRLSNLPEPTRTTPVAQASSLSLLAAAMRISILAPPGLLPQWHYVAPALPAPRPQPNEVYYLMCGLRAWWRAGADRQEKIGICEEYRRQQCQDEVAKHLEIEFCKLSATEIRYMAKAAWTLVTNKKEGGDFKGDGRRAVAEYLGWDDEDLGMDTKYE